MESTPLAEAPRTIGPYRLTRILGQGGTGTVYLAERTDFTQRVALKLFHPAFLTAGLLGPDGEEARILALLDHPHIVRTISQAAEPSGVRYLVMEYIDGEPIDRFADTHKLSLAARTELLLQALDALEHAHRHLIVHRDLKPAHLLITADAQAKLLDFGTAGELAPAAFTPDYSSPEQRSPLPDAPPVSVASDLYSLGLIARLVLAGIPSTADPETAPSVLLSRLAIPQREQIAAARATSAAHLLRTLRGDLDAILLRSLRPSPDARYLSASQFSSDLRGSLDGSPVLARPVSPAERSRRWILQHRLLSGAAAVLVLAVLFSAVGVLWQSGRAIAQRRRTENRLRDLVRLTGTLDGGLYTSLGTLHNSDPERSLLLTSTTRTLDDLSATAGADPVLSLELAGQYHRLAALELARTSTENARPDAAHDIDRALELLASVKPSASGSAALNRERTELIKLRAALRESRP